jgi:probable HAF family extracellular repeat protein
MIDLSTLGGPYSVAYGINVSGQIVGSSRIDSSYTVHAFIDPDGAGPRVMIDLSTLGGTSSEANGINASGLVVGDSQVTGDGATHAFIDLGGAGSLLMIDLGTLGGTNSYAYGINASGQVVGQSQVTGDGATHAFIDPDGYGFQPMINLGTLGGTNSYAYGINASGQVVGDSEITGNGATHAFIDPDGAGPQALQDLNNLILPNSGLVLGGGIHTVAINDFGQIAAVGGFGAGSTTRSFLLTPDTTAPAIACPGPISETTQPALTSATVTDNLDPNPVITNNAPTLFPYGITTVTWTATDAAGNSASCSQSVTLLDVTPPNIIEMLTPPLPASGWYNVDVSLYWSISDPETGVAARVNCPDATNPIMISTDTPVIGNSYTCQATNGFGISNSGTVNVKRDTVPPVFSTIPADVSAPATSASGATVIYTDPTVTDAASGIAAASCTPPSGSAFAFGTTAVNCNATDLAGNGASAAFHVSVQNTVAPTITCPADVVSTDGATVALGTAMAADAFGTTLTPTYSPNPLPSPFPVGNTAITWTATDAYSNTASCKQKVVILPALTFLQTDAGNYTTCEVKLDGQLSCWGDPAYGMTTPPAGAFIKVSVGDAHACGLRADGTLSCWGDSAYGKNAPPVASRDHFTDVYAAIRHSCAIKTDGSALCWGWNAYGQASPPSGNNTYSQISAGMTHTCAVKTNGALSCWGDNTYGKATPPAGTFTEVTSGWDYNCALKTDGTVVCWGDNTYGQRTPSTGSATYTHVSAGYNHSCASKSDNTVVCWGRNDFSQASPPADGFIQVSAGGDYHTCGVRIDGTLRCWGRSNVGQAPTFVINPASLPNGMEGTSYSQNVSFDVTNNPIGSLQYVPNLKQYTVSSGSLPPGVVLTGNALTGTLGTPGDYSFTVTGTDSNRFAASQAYTVTITPSDTTPPVITPIVTGSIGANGWYTSDVNVSWTVTDNIDPNPTKTGCTTTTVTTETASQVITCSATDHSNNTASHSVTIKLDKTIPALGTSPVVGPIEATSSAGATVIYSNPTATDNLGTPTVQCGPVTNTVLPIGSHTVTCIATDNAGLSSTGSFNVLVHDTTPPTLLLPSPMMVLATSGSGAAVTYSASAIDLVSTGVLANCTPLSGSTFSVGSTTVNCSASDGIGNTATGSFSVTVTPLPVNHPPVAANDSIAIAHIGTSAVTVPATLGVLANDSDPDGNLITVVGAPKVITLTTANGTISTGTVNMNADGSFTYNPPNASFVGTRYFTYQVTDGQAVSNTATVTLTIRRAPTAANDSATTSQDQAVPINIVANDTAYNTATIVPGTATIVSLSSNGDLMNNGNGTVTYTPNAGFVGTDAFTYSVSDSTGAPSNIATVTVYVPVAINDSYTFTANTSASQTISRTAATGVLANDQPIGRAGRTVTLISGITRTGGTGTATLGQLTLNTNGAFSFTLTAPTSARTGALRQATKRGTYQFTYTETLSGVTTAPATVAITIQ